MSQQDVIEAPTQVGKIGRVLLESGRLTELQAEKVLLRQQERKIRFGEAAIEAFYQSVSDAIGIPIMVQDAPAAGTPFPRFIADLQGNAGYVCGSETRGFRSVDLKACRVSLWIDDERVHDAVGGHPQGDPSLPLVAWANAQCDRLGGLRAGQIVTTGTLTPPRLVDRPCRVRATIEGVGEVALSLSAALG